MRRPDEDVDDLPVIKPTPPAELKPVPDAPVVETVPYWTEAKVLRWGSTGLAIALAIPFLVKLSNALDGSWSWSWLPWLVFIPVAAFSAYTWRQFLDAEEAAKKEERAAKQAAFRFQVNKPQAGENQNWST